MTTPSKILALFAALAALFALGACSGGDDAAPEDKGSALERAEEAANEANESAEAVDDVLEGQ